MDATPLGALVPGFDPLTATYLAAGIGIAAVVVASRTLSRLTGAPYPVFLVLAGAAASFLPALGHIGLEPRVVFLGFLPPLVYHAGLAISPRELRAHALPIGLGALGLVLATTFAVAGLASAVAPGLGFVGSFVLGAVVAPTDAVAATSVLKRLGLPPHVTTILEGESLVNDGIALALFGVGVAAVAGPTGPAVAFADFLEVVAGGVAVGLVVGWLATRAQRALPDGASQIVVSLVVPFAAYLPADSLGLSGVLATLVTGLFLGQQPASGLGASGRIRMAEFWQVLVFLLESTLFVLVGLQLRRLLAGVGSRPASSTAMLALLTVLTVIAVRLAWWLAIPTLRWRPAGRLVDTGGVPAAERLALGWSGLRGAMSLAAALSIPAAVSGHRFPGRDLVIFTTFWVIAATLVGQGTTLPVVLRRSAVGGGRVERGQQALAQRRCAEVALRVLDELSEEGDLEERAAEMLRVRYERRLRRASDEVEGAASIQPAPLSRRAVEDRLLVAQHDVLRDLHRGGEITFSVMRSVRRELDLEHARFEQ